MKKEKHVEIMPSLLRNIKKCVIIMISHTVTGDDRESFCPMSLPENRQKV